MQHLIYYLLNKFFMNPIEKEIVKYLDNKYLIVFDVGCFRGTFTKRLINCGYKLGIKFNKVLTTLKTVAYQTMTLQHVE